MKIAFHDYALKIQGTNKCREGTLLRFSFEEGYGYADCHPWTEFGDSSLPELKEGLRKGLLTPLTKRSADFAKLDAQARSEGRFLLHSKVKNHLHYTGNLQPGFDRIKMKLRGGENVRAIMEQAPNVKWRFDFNSTSNYDDFCTFLDEIDVSKVDFIEDPFPFDKSLWQKIENNYRVQLAADFEKKKLHDWLPKVLIIKPAVDDLEEYRHKKVRIILTSYLAHPLEQMATIYCALQLNSKETMGIFTHGYYEKNDFSACFGNAQESFFHQQGTGFGFDHILARLDWHD